MKISGFMLDYKMEKAFVNVEIRQSVLKNKSGLHGHQRIEHQITYGADGCSLLFSLIY